ncbi:MAG TPA: hypothetical protein VFZ66_04585 [Herpetosiphonaceae bacterium]
MNAALRSRLPRFIALALRSGYGWLGAGGLGALIVGGVMAGPIYDAILHAVFVGFVISMILGNTMRLARRATHDPARSAAQVPRGVSGSSRQAVFKVSSSGFPLFFALCSLCCVHHLRGSSRMNGGPPERPCGTRS